MKEGMNPLPDEEMGAGSQEPGQKTILDRVIKETGVSDLLDILTGIPNTDLQSLLLEVMEKKSLKTGVQEINSALESNPYVEMSEVDQRAFVKFDSLAYDLLPLKYSGVELSPLVPFATNRVLADISQKRVLSTTRNSEVISDPTTALAIYCAKERYKMIRKNPMDSELVALAASQRVIRQGQIKKAGYYQHFRTFTVAAAGRDAGFEKFEQENFEEHLNFFLSLLRMLNEGGGYSINDITVTSSDVRGGQSELLNKLKNSVIKNLADVFPKVNFKFDLDRASNYYDSLCYSISAKNKDSEVPISVAGGGMTDWTQTLVGSKKERILVGSVGSETLCRHFIN